MLQKDFIAKIGQEFGLDPAHIKAVAEKKLAINVDNGEALSFLIYLKNIDFIQLSLITAVDWIDENRFELVYTLVSWEKNLTVSVSTFIPRDNPVMVSVRHIWPTAKYYEWDINEFFGIIFSGHPEMGNPLFLEGWSEKPPMRKDFDPQAYSYERFPSRKYDYKVENKGRVIE